MVQFSTSRSFDITKLFCHTMFIYYSIHTPPTSAPTTLWAILLTIPTILHNISYLMSVAVVWQARWWVAAYRWCRWSASARWSAAQVPAGVRHRTTCSQLRCRCNMLTCQVDKTTNGK